MIRRAMWAFTLLALGTIAQAGDGAKDPDGLLTEARTEELKKLDLRVRRASRAGDLKFFKGLVAPAGVSCMDGMAPRASVVAAMEDPVSPVWAALLGKSAKGPRAWRRDEDGNPSYREFFTYLKDEEVSVYISFDDPGRNVALIQWSSHAGAMGPSVELSRRDGAWFLTEWRPICHLAKF